MSDPLHARIAEQANLLAEVSLVAPAAESERIDDLISRLVIVNMDVAATR